MRISALGSFLFNGVENDARLVEIDTFDEKSIHRSFVLSNKKVSGEFSLWADLKKDVTSACHDDALTGRIRLFFFASLVHRKLCVVSVPYSFCSEVLESSKNSK
jgi:hypothetical protein